VRQATGEDGAALAALLFRNPQDGRLLVGQQRADMFARASPFADSATWLVPGPGGEPAAAVSVATKDVSVAGAPVTAGYVFDLVVDAAARGRGLARRLLDTAERWARERGAQLLYASIIGGNEASLAVFHAAGYRIRIPMGMRLYPVFRNRPDEPAPAPDWAAAARGLRAEARGYDLVPQPLLDDVRGVWSRLPGWRDEDTWVTDRATLALWDHRAVTLPIPLRLPGELRLLAAMSKVAKTLRIPFPPAPAVGEPLATGYLLTAGGADDALRDGLLAALARARARGLDLVILAHPGRARPGWSRGAFSVDERYDIVVNILDPTLGAVGSRPVWADPADL
jgi:GNAT superfamily N-acetyltransferase